MHRPIRMLDLKYLQLPPSLLRWKGSLRDKQTVSRSKCLAAVSESKMLRCRSKEVMQEAKLRSFE